MEKKTLKKWNIVRDTKRNNANNMHANSRTPRALPDYN